MAGIHDSGGPDWVEHPCRDGCTWENSLKVWIVDVQTKAQLAVVAENEEDAKEMAKKHLAEELAHNLHEASYTARILDRPINLMGGLRGPLGGTLPWGVDEDDPRRNWCLEQWLGMW